MKAAEVRCNCQDCRSHTLADCINNRCDCCDLEDAFAVISGQEAPDILLA
jgi:hypothetical protein